MLGWTLEKPKENLCFLLQTLKMLGKIQVLRLWEPLGDPKGVRAGLGTPILGPKHQKLSNTGRCGSVWGDIRTVSILQGLRSLWDDSCTLKGPKMGR